MLNFFCIVLLSGLSPDNVEDDSFVDVQGGVTSWCISILLFFAVSHRLLLLQIGLPFKRKISESCESPECMLSCCVVVQG